MATTRDQFIAQMGPLAVQAGQQLGIDPRLIIAQAAQETGWGRHVPGGNYFGIKSHGQPGGATFSTNEVINGQNVSVNDSFRQYGSMADSVQGYVDFLLANPRYREMLQAQGLDAQLAALGRSGYATDPNYASSVGQIARSINLDGVEPAPATVVGAGSSNRTTTPTAGSGGYTVQQGDTLWAIARDNGVSLADLIAANPQISNPDLINIGQQITIPGQNRSQSQPTSFRDRVESFVQRWFNRNQWGQDNPTLVSQAPQRRPEGPPQPIPQIRPQPQQRAEPPRPPMPTQAFGWPEIQPRGFTPPPLGYSGPVANPSWHGEHPTTGRPMVQGANGALASEETVTIRGADGNWVNIPTIINGRRVDEAEAERLHRMGLNPALGGAFASLGDAVAAAQQRTGLLGRALGQTYDATRNTSVAGNDPGAAPSGIPGFDAVAAMSAPSFDAASAFAAPVKDEKQFSLDPQRGDALRTAGMDTGTYKDLMTRQASLRNPEPSPKFPPPLGPAGVFAVTGQSTLPMAPRTPTMTGFGLATNPVAVSPPSVVPQLVARKLFGNATA